MRPFIPTSFNCLEAAEGRLQGGFHGLYQRAAAAFGDLGRVLRKADNSL